MATLNRLKRLTQDLERTRQKLAELQKQEEKLSEQIEQETKKQIIDLVYEHGYTVESLQELLQAKKKIQEESEGKVSEETTEEV